MQKVTTVLSFTGSTQTFRVPYAVTNIFIQAWGAAGGSQGGLGGPGGYSQGTLLVAPKDLLTAIVGQGGIPWSVSQTNALLPTFGGGGAGGNATGEQFKGSSAGGRTALRNAVGTEVITAGGGGGSSSSFSESGTINGGPGGGTNGVDGFVSIACYNIMMGKGGTQVSGGAGGSGFTAFNNGGAGSQFTGGAGGGGSNGGLSAGAAGGGGGGFFGGGGGAGSFQAGLGCPPSAGSQDCSGGGGSGFIGGVTNAFTASSTTPGTSPFNPPGTALPNYVSGVGVARSASIGGNGLLVLTYTVPTLTKIVDKSNAAVGDTLDYTLVFDNTSGVTLNNIVFVDTIPNGTEFVANSLTVNSNSVSGSPAPPGVNLGNIANVITIFYKVKVTTVPSPNPIPNVGSISADNLDPTISNTVTTRVNYINLPSSKTVSKAFAQPGDILTYTIPVSNTGNVTAENLVFLDTLPAEVSYIAGSLKQNGVVVTGVTSLISATLPSNLPSNGTSNISFQVQVLTIPNPNPIQNTANIVANYTIDSTTVPTRIGQASTNTNAASTRINIANLGNSVKSVSKNFATCKDILVYTITVPNNGNVSALNVILKDTIPNGTIFITDSVTIDGVQKTGENPLAGINIGTVGPGSQRVVEFSVQVDC